MHKRLTLQNLKLNKKGKRDATKIVLFVELWIEVFDTLKSSVFNPDKCLMHLSQVIKTHLPHCLPHCLPYCKSIYTV